MGIQTPQLGRGNQSWCLESHGSSSTIEVDSQYLAHVSVLECTPTSGLHPHVGLGPLLTARAVVQVLGLDELQALLNLGGLKLDKVQVACVDHPCNFSLQSERP